MDWIKGFLIPIIECAIIGGIIGFFGFYFGKAIYRAWSRKAKFFFKYKIMKKKYPEKTLKWCLECIEKKISWHNAKKMLYLNMMPEDEIFETLFIYDETLKAMGINKQELETKNESKELPLFQNDCKEVKTK